VQNAAAVCAFIPPSFAFGTTAWGSTIFYSDLATYNAALAAAGITTDVTFGPTTPAAIPEPSTFVLLASGALICGLIKRFVSSKA
jgi:hypothetical protein